MNVRNWTRLFLLIPLLLSVVHLPPAQATGPSQLADTAKVIWCPASVTLPKSSREGCTPAFDNLTGASGLLDYLAAHIPSQAGVVWIGKTYNSSTVLDTHVSFNGALLGKMAKYALTIKGGWNGLGKGTLDPNSRSTFDGARFDILNWKGKISVKNILVQNTNRDGAFFSNTASLSTPPGSVTVTNSQFLDNIDAGLFITTNGAVMLKTVKASRNEIGTVIANNLDANASQVSVSNGQFNGNGLKGLAIFSNGTAMITNVYAEGNGSDGVTVDNTYGLGNVIVTGVNTFLDNDVSGLSVYSKGSVTASYLMAYQNVQYGVDIQNHFSPSAKGVAITRGGDFMGNGWGLHVKSNGSLNLNRINGSSNSNFGMILHTDGNATLTCSSAYGNSAAIQARASDGVSPLPKLTLQGFISYGNTFGNTPNEDFSTTPVTRTNCPYP